MPPQAAQAQADQPRDTQQNAGIDQSARVAELAQEFQKLNTAIPKNSALGRIWKRNSPRIKNELDLLINGKVPAELTSTVIDGVEAKINDWKEVAGSNNKPTVSKDNRAVLPQIPGFNPSRGNLADNILKDYARVIGPKDASGVEVLGTAQQLAELMSNKETREYLRNGKGNLKKDIESQSREIHEKITSSPDSTQTKSSANASIKRGKFPNDETISGVHLLSAGVKINEPSGTLKLSRLDGQNTFPNIKSVIIDGQLENKEKQLIITAHSADSDQVYKFIAIVGGGTTQVKDSEQKK